MRGARMGNEHPSFSPQKRTRPMERIMSILQTRSPPKKWTSQVIARLSATTLTVGMVCRKLRTRMKKRKERHTSIDTASRRSHKLKWKASSRRRVRTPIARLKHAHMCLCKEKARGGARKPSASITADAVGVRSLISIATLSESRRVSNTWPSPFQECGGSQICEHNRRREHCKVVDFNFNSV
jgi:hypothetical protein